jgi:hypothetical protein
MPWLGVEQMCNPKEVAQRLSGELKVEINRLGTKRWYLKGKLHREDAPAIEYADGGKAWYLNGEFHREDGPAIEYANGDKEWWVKGVFIKEEF